MGLAQKLRRNAQNSNLSLGSFVVNLLYVMESIHIRISKEFMRLGKRYRTPITHTQTKFSFVKFLKFPEK